MVHKKSMINHINFSFFLVRPTYCIQVRLFYFNFLFIDSTEGLLMVLKYHVLSES